MLEKLCPEPECAQQQSGSLLTSGENGQPISSFTYRNRTWRQWMSENGILVRLIDTNSGDRAFVDSDYVYCSGAIDAALSHISFNAVEAVFADFRLYLNVETSVVYVWALTENEKL